MQLQLLCYSNCYLSVLLFILSNWHPFVNPFIYLDSSLPFTSVTFKVLPLTAGDLLTPESWLNSGDQRNSATVLQPGLVSISESSITTTILLVIQSSLYETPRMLPWPLYPVCKHSVICTYRYVHIFAV